MAVAACFSGLALANPTNPTVVHGTASFQQAGGVLNVTNSHNAIINWGSFSIGVNELTRFIQPSALSAVLNRVTGQDPSAILGALQSNGRVFLLNPNGIMFGAGAQINVAGLVASTLNMSNEDFLSGRMRFTDGAGAGSVINQGAINASGGPVYLVGNAVTNQGIITSPQGEIVLAAGNSVELVNPGTPNLRVEIQSDSNEARNLGSIVADAGRIGIYAGLVKQGGVINADSVVAEGGRIMLKSTKRTDIEAGSVTSARGTNGGEILALSGMSDGVVQVSGTLNASSNAATAPGNGGFIETSAATVNVADTASVAAEARNGGSRGRWLIDPSDYVIAATGGNTSGAALSLALNGANGGTEIDIQSSSGGSIQVNDAIAWSSAADLRMFAYGGDINVNQSIANNDAGSLKLYAGWDGASMSAPVVSGTGAINLSAGVSVGGGVHLVAGGNITQNSGGDMMAAQLLAKSVNGTVNLTQNGNSIGTVAGSSSGNFHLKNAGALTVGSVGGVNGITSGSGLISLIASGGSLSQTSAGVLTAPELLAISTNSSVNLTAASNAVGTVAGRSAGQFALKNAGNLVVGSVDGTDGIIVNGSNPGLHAAVNLDVTGSLTVNQYVKAIGATSGISSAGGNGTTTLSSTGAMTLNAEVLAQGGDGAEGRAGGNAVLSLTSGGGMTVNGAVTALAGHGGETYYSSTPAGQGGGSTLSLTNSNSTASVLVGILGNVQSTGGGGGDSYAFEFDSPAGRGGDGVVIISSDGGFVHQGYVGASGGHGGERTGGAAGRGGDASMQVSAFGAGGLQVANGSTISASGGQGGPAIFAVGGGTLFNGGGGDALVQLASSGGMTVEGNVYATGGSLQFYYGDDGGNAGNATIRMTSGSTLTTTSTANIRADGGEGWGSSSRGGHALVDLKSSGNLLISGGDVNANGGDGGSNASGGNATIKVVSTGGSATFVAPYVVATGGGADSFSSGNGGDGVVQVEALGEISLNSTDLTAYGGQSGSAGVAGGALVLMSTSGNMSITNSSYVQAWGGSGGYMSSGLQAGGAGVTLLAGGTALIDGSEGSAFGGGSADTGGAAAVNVVAGSVAINNGTLYAQRGSGNVNSGSSGILVASAGGISMDGAWVYSSGGFAGLVGSSVLLDNNTDVTGGTGVGATVTGSLTLNNGSTLGGSGGNATITTSGDVVVNNYSSIRGNPDVMLRVGGSVRMNDGGTIEAGSVETINLTFLVNNGNSFFVNGLKDVVYDAATGTGFMANGQPAQLGDSLKVSYLENVVTTLKIPSETLIVAMNSATKPPDEQKKSTDPVGDKDGGDSKDGKEKKKSLPICGK